MTDREKAIEVLRLSEPMQKIHSLMETAICIAKRESYLTDEEEATLRKAVELAIQALKQEPCEDAISRSDAIRVASGYCHWSNIPKELAKLPSVNPIPCEDAISRQTLKDLGAECIAKRDENGNLIPLGSIDSLPSVSQKQEIPIDCSDSICRADAIKLVKSYIHEIITESGVDKNSHTNKILTDIVKFLAFELPSVSTEKTGHCKDCKYFEYDSVAKVDGIPLIVAHEICSKWGDGCKTREDGYCFLFEPQPYKGESEE